MSDYQALCCVCEGENALIACNGGCLRYFHIKCLDQSTASQTSYENWTCKNCLDKYHKCLLCNGYSYINEDFKKCSVSRCGGFYHWECIIEHPLSKVYKNTTKKTFQCPRHKCFVCEESSSTKGTMYSCMRCYNTGHNKCITDDCVRLKYNKILCYNHPTPYESSSLLPEIVKNEIVFKVFNKYVCIFPAKFSRFKSFKLPRNYCNNIEDCEEELSEIEYDGIIPKYPAFHKKTCRNIYISKPTTYIEKDQECYCREGDSCDEGKCYNRSCLIECHPKICYLGDKCNNQRLQKRQYASTEIYFTGNRGWGVRSKESISANTLIVEYCGEVIDDEMCKKRFQELKERNETNFYFFQISKNEIIDAGPKGNLARFINHSCNPNCVAQKWMVKDRIRVGIYTKYDVKAGEELTYDYNFENFFPEGQEQICHCRSKNCSGKLGVRPLKLTNFNPKSKKRKRKINTKKKEKIENENEITLKESDMMEIENVSAINN